jgi:predicted alpha/beta-hydrolase family hydrolase
MARMPERFRVSVGDESVSAVHYPAAAPALGWTLILGHGAGADQSSEFMVAFAEALAARGLELVTFNFPYTEAGRGAPDRPPKLEATYRALIAAVEARLPGRKLAIGGKSMGGRIASQVAPGVQSVHALVFLGYPLHPPKQLQKLRIAHLPEVRRPMLFVQGEKDAFGTPEELAPILRGLAPPATVHAVALGDHSLKVPKKSGVAQADVYANVQNVIVRWLATLA